MKGIEEKQIEAPYELPEGWKWCRLGEVADWGSGGTPSRKNPEYYQGSIPWIKTGELNETYIFDSEEKVSEDAIKHSSAKIFPKETVVMAMYGATIGKTAIFGIDASTNQACACAICHKELDNHFLFNFLKSKKDYFLYNAKGGAQPNISQEIIKNTLIPLPPTLAEQQRIVKRIESMFAKLDEAKEKAQNVVDGFETRKAAILHKAFTGELTAKWRKENGVSDDSWVEKLFDSCIAKMQNGLSKRSGNEGEETVVLRLANMGEDDFDVSDLRTIKLTSKEKNNYSLAKNDVVMIRVNGSKTNVGRQLLVKNNKGWSFCDHIIRIQFEVFCLPNYMVYFSKTKEYIDYVQDNMVSSAGQNTISRKGLSNLSLKVPTLPEQQEIVRILEIIIEKENKAKQAAEAVLEQIDLLKKSILARAFRGEL